MGACSTCSVFDFLRGKWRNNATNGTRSNDGGFAGKDPFKEAVIDSLVEQYIDYKNEIKPFIYAFLGFAPGDVDKLKKETFMPAHEKFLGYATKFLKKIASSGKFITLA
ncbi:hypothetical protein KIN20_010257 [Parelaphostrongylus tenuis]|uniref:Uncharacterized protein n=1 Tax=Parelaphostrongylus tenuis TaxID=148309 RepID=A0AAD5MTT9_PARTN|nr:hypothetical protein KIN20_010257 [Parelaphostrongylus tenuis]